ncbi:MAG: hypothetical protein DWP94_15030 [Flavobacterium sp.]|nr:MAG: hypothetical protein DWP94_15030 [Flavobacterium sp.]
MLKQRHSIFCFFTALMLLMRLGYGQLYEVTRYADDNGLPSRIVHDVDQDSEGYLWVAGNNGLYKFDGHKFHAYYAVLNDTTGLRNNRINTLIADSNDRIWIGTPKGLHVMEQDEIRYVPLEKNSTDSQEHITAIFEDADKNIWVGTYDGFYRIADKDGRVDNFAEHLLWNEKKSTVWGFSQDKAGNIWIARATYPPLMLPKGRSTFKELNLKIADEDLPDDLTVFNYIEYETGHFLVGSPHGLLKGSYDLDSIFTISRYRTPDNKPLPRYHINKTVIDSEGAIWIATWRNYYKKFHFKGEFIEEQEVIGMNDYGEMSGFARSVFEDRQHNLWMPNSNGLFKFSETTGNATIFPPPHRPNCIENISVYSIIEDKFDRLWINTPTHLYRIAKADILNNKCPIEYLSLVNPHFQLSRDMFIDSRDRLWISGQGGISVTQLDKNHEPGDFVHYTPKNGLPHLWSFEILEESPETFWVTNYHGLLKLTLIDGDIRKPLFTTYESNNEIPTTLVNSYTLQLEKDKEGSLWIGTFSGLSKLISETAEGNFSNYTASFGRSDHLSNNSIKKIFRDSKDRLWIGTQTGLNLYIEETDSFIQFGRPEGLPSEYILGIAEDSENQLWITTTNGVFKGIYNESMKAFVHIEYFMGKDGLADNISNRNAIYIDADDKVFIGSSKGISVLNNVQSHIDLRKYNLSITTLESIRKKESGFVSVLNRMKNNKIQLSAGENSIRLHYAVLDFTKPEFNQYRHKFLPLSEDWVETGNSSQLTYYNLSPGSYELILDGHNNQGIWSGDPLKLSIVVAPPFWRSNMAFALYILLALGIIRMLYIMRIKKKMHELEQETRLEKALILEREQLRNENAADFHDELGSKVTKISMFLTLAERTLKEKKDPTNWLGKMRENIKDLSGSFRDLLWVIDPKKDSLADAFLRLKDFGDDLFGTSETRFSTLGYSEKLNVIKLDPQTKKQVVLIFKEAMHNCAKYANATLVELSISHTDHYSTLILKDNGNGFNVHEQGEGRGLPNMKQRAEKIGGKLNIVSNKNGTSVKLENIPHLGEENSI